MRILGILGGAVAFAAVAAACGSSEGTGGFTSSTKDGGGQALSDGGPVVDIPDSGSTGGDGGGGTTTLSGDPATCAEAAQFKTYVGCDYWPTVTGNNVWSIFDFAVIVANSQSAAAQVTVTGPNGVNKSVTVPANSLEKVYLPWVSALKGPDADACGGSTALSASVRVAGGAYHLVSSIPVAVYQFNALEYRGAGGPSGKNWATCPGSQCAGGPVPCFSYSNDASLLLPSTAMTGTYRVAGTKGWTESNILSSRDIMGPYFTITGTVDNTDVSVKLSSAAKVLAGGGLTAASGGATLTLKLNAGDVVEIVGAAGASVDFSGSLVSATQPVQVLSGVPCINIPAGKLACDHVEEIVFPAETLGKEYVVAPMTGPNGTAPGHVVKFVGNKDGTTLSYAPSRPSGCPASLNAGQVVECTGLVTTPFIVTGSNEFAISNFMPAGEVLDPNAIDYSKGDPSQSAPTAVEQFRTKYNFLAPDDYPTSYVDIVGPVTAKVVLDGAALSATFKPVANGVGIARVKLGAGARGAHVLTSDVPVGIQVMGYGDNTSYQYPGGLDLKRIAIVPDK